ncbi:MAG: peptidoglycan editing factor PgeF [Acidobacteria bacterium]|nr:peptidoglycan editing factor PgeF [Acidobacteriota bacterium]
MSGAAGTGSAREDEPALLQIRQWSFPWLIHGFGTRQSERWTHRQGRTWVHQIHSNMVHRAAEPGYVADGDALVTDLPGLLLEIRTADCMPVLLVDPVRRAVGIAHAGWRGTVAGIAARTVQQMVDEFGCQITNIQAAFGPSIGPCCFEVGPEVAAQFAPSAVVQPGPHRLAAAPGRVTVDLLQANKTQLFDAGLARESIFQASSCTMCHPEQFHSYRRDRDQSGRLVSGIGMLA